MVSIDHLWIFVVRKKALISYIVLLVCHVMRNLGRWSPRRAPLQPNRRIDSNHSRNPGHPSLCTLKRRSATTHFKWIKGHSGDQGNEASDVLAKEGARKERPDEIDLSIPKEFDLQGAKLSTINQATIKNKGRREKILRRARNQRNNLAESNAPPPSNKKYGTLPGEPGQ